MPTATRQRRRLGLVQPFPERQGRRRPEQEARRVGIDQVGLAVQPGHQQQRAGHDQPHPHAVAPRQEVKADRDREGKLDDRRHPPRGDVFHPVTEKGVGCQVQLARQRRMKIDAVPAVRPEVEQRDRDRKPPGRRSRSGPCSVAPTTGPRRPGCSGTPVRPRSARNRPRSEPVPPARPASTSASGYAQPAPQAAGESRSRRLGILDRPGRCDGFAPALERTDSAISTVSDSGMLLILVARSAGTHVRRVFSLPRADGPFQCDLLFLTIIGLDRSCGQAGDPVRRRLAQELAPHEAVKVTRSEKSSLCAQLGFATWRRII